MPGATAGRVSARRQSALVTGGGVGAYLLTTLGAVSLSYGADAELGRYLSSECMTCHGTAKGDSTIPNIFGLAQTHFVEVLRAYRAKALPNPVMQTIAGRLNDEDIAALALYFETAKKSN
jgi:cytochrome c